MSEPQWERQVLEKLATAALTEQRRTRQWKLFFRLVWVLLAILPSMVTSVATWVSKPFEEIFDKYIQAT